MVLRAERPSYAITIPCTSFTRGLLTKKYTKDEITESVHRAKTISEINAEDPIAMEMAWKDAHVITCDDAWGIGIGSQVDFYMKRVTSAFMKELLESTSEYMDKLSIANFMTRYHRQRQDDSYIRLLRMYLLAFPESFETPSTLRDLHLLHFPEGNRWTCYTPMIMATSSVQIPGEVMLTLLQCGVPANARSVHGDTSLILACKYWRGLEDTKVDILLNYGANIEDLDSSLMSAFHAAMTRNSKPTIIKLLAAREQRIKDSMQAGGHRLRQNGLSAGTGNTTDEDESDDDDGMSDDYSPGDGEDDRHSGRDLDVLFDEISQKDYVTRVEKQMTLHETYGYKDPEFKTRLRNKHLLYLDPLQMVNLRDESLLIYATRFLNVSRIHDIESNFNFIDLFVKAGVKTDGNWGENKNIPTRVGQQKELMSVGSPKEMHFGVAKFCVETGDDEDGSLTFSVQKEFYNTQVHIQLSEVLNFIDFERSYFPFAEIPSNEDILQIFMDMRFGKKFDYCVNTGDCTGEDFQFHFYVSEFAQPWEGRHEYLKTGLLYSHSIQIDKFYPEHRGKIHMRFPKGPLPKSLFFNSHGGIDDQDDEDDPFYLAFTTVNKRSTFLQESVTLRNREQRGHAYKLASMFCNPLITGLRGLTALQLLELNLKQITMWKGVENHGTALLNRSDRGLLRRVRKEHDEMLIIVDRNGLVHKTNSILFDATEKKISDAYNKRRADMKPRSSSMFHGLPGDVCSKIVSFL